MHNVLQKSKRSLSYEKRFSVKRLLLKCPETETRNPLFSAYCSITEALNGQARVCPHQPAIERVRTYRRHYEYHKILYYGMVVPILHFWRGSSAMDNAQSLDALENLQLLRILRGQEMRTRICSLPMTFESMAML